MSKCKCQFVYTVLSLLAARKARQGLRYIKPSESNFTHKYHLMFEWKCDVSFLVNDLPKCL